MSIQLVPETAPFSPQQRAWLNGFLAGVIGILDQEHAQGGSSTSLAAAAALVTPPLGSSAEDANAIIHDDLPWHDANMSIDERLKLAEGRPKSLRLMAAMAQLNCGSCGYQCKTYAEAIADGTEKNLTLCSPGGSETAKMVRKIQKESAHNRIDNSSNQTIIPQALPGTRQNPVTARLKCSNKLNGLGSTKDTRHVELDLSGTNLQYNVGDALGVFATNCNELVLEVLKLAQIPEKVPVQVNGKEMCVSEALMRKCLRYAPPDLFECSIAHIEQRPKFNGAVANDSAMVAKLKSILERDEIDRYDVLEFFRCFPEVYLPAQSLIDSLPCLAPRLYSIASSQSKFANEVHLTVGRVETMVDGRAHKGVASTMFADRLLVGAGVDVFVHRSHGFTVPSDDSVPMIMVGPGTGIAPFMAFLQERQVRNATGKNWLFFGDQKSSCDYLYREQLESWHSGGLLTHLDLAFSRDTEQKVYVQHRMVEHGAELHEWLKAGAYLFVCGDASRMAKDVEQTLRDILCNFGGHTVEEANAYLSEMAKAKRYVKDVY